MQGALPTATDDAGDQAAALARFHDIVLHDPGLQDRLGRHETADPFVDDVRAIARDHGVGLSEQTVRQMIRPDPVGISRFVAPPVALDRWPNAGWRPARSAPGPDAPMFDWAWFGDASLSDPFYERTVRRMASRPFSLMFLTRTSLSALVAGHDADDALVPDGFVFHLSRCGSTLAGRMLAAVPGHVVVSEAEPIDAVVQWAIVSGRPLEDQVAALRAVVAAVGRSRGAHVRRYFVKLDSWHTRALPLFRAAFPDVPWVFLYREPLEVMASQLRLRGLQTLPGGLPPHVLDMPDGELLPTEQFCALALERIGAAALDHMPLGGGMLVDYADLIAAMMERVPQHFAFTPDTDEASAMAAAATYDAKKPAARFESDSADKRAQLPPEVVAVVEKWLRPIHTRLRAQQTEWRAGAA